MANEVSINSASTDEGGLVSCDVCGRNMRDTETGVTITALQVGLRGDTDRIRLTVGRVYPEINQDHVYKICYVCWLRSFGVRLPGGTADQEGRLNGETTDK